MTTLDHKIDFAVVLTVTTGIPLTATVQDKTMRAMAKSPMWPLSVKSETGFRIWVKKYLFNLMTGQMTVFPA